MSRPITPDATDQSTVVRFVDSTDGTPETGVTEATAGLALWYRREGGLKVAITPVALAALNTAHTDGGVEHISDGYVRIDAPDAAFVTGATGVAIGGSATGMVVIGSYHPIDALVSSRLAPTVSGRTVDVEPGGEVTPIAIDGLTFESVMELIMAVLAGVAVPSGSTVAFKERDGATTKITITYGAADGERTVSTIA